MILRDIFIITTLVSINNLSKLIGCTDKTCYSFSALDRFLPVTKKLAFWFVSVSFLRQSADSSSILQENSTI